ncbi:hypothetical protein GCK72_003996 [Caenorhabditis remanei]|uniref:BTB domain-containing protein n=1 Tax=Caenorhabditis remanei TaxID=31234 RepID=A0A6A5H878_CAERE|nr:hypothetical protein GCK72_003996 [Caenorhabditis remanei]KAF1764050.1 hypothetical protein GCK72_003996 [Caenorhabditis remanei]
MSIVVFKHNSSNKIIMCSDNYVIHEISKSNGLECEVKTRTTPQEVCVSWIFNWNQLNVRMVIGFTGEIIVKRSKEIVISVNLSMNQNLIVQRFPNTSVPELLQFEYSLLPIVVKQFYCNNELFLPSETNDAVLEVNGLMKFYVNKGFLSYHSDFFCALFSSNFKEGNMNEIPIKDVSYDEIGLLLSTIHPKPIFPNDKTVPKILELADRFLVPSAIYHVEYHLLNNTKIENEKLLWMADKYGMEELLEKMIKELDTIQKTKQLKASDGYNELSDKAKAKILDKIVTII